MPKRMLRPIAAPMNSARSVAIAITSAWSQSATLVLRENRSRQTSGRFMPGGDPELRAHRLDHHRHQVRHEDDPEQQVAELRAAGHVRREVAGVDVRDRRDERRPEKRPEPPRAAPAPRERLLRRLEDARLAGEDVIERVDGRRAVVLPLRLRRLRAARAVRAGCGHPTRSPVAHIAAMPAR